MFNLGACLLAGYGGAEQVGGISNFRNYYNQSTHPLPIPLPPPPPLFQDGAAAAQQFSSAAEKGHGPAFYRYGKCLARGIGVARDAVAAAGLFGRHAARACIARGHVGGGGVAPGESIFHGSACRSAGGDACLGLEAAAQDAGPDSDAALGLKEAILCFEDELSEQTERDSTGTPGKSAPGCFAPWDGCQHVVVDAM